MVPARTAPGAARPAAPAVRATARGVSRRARHAHARREADAARWRVLHLVDAAGRREHHRRARARGGARAQSRRRSRILSRGRRRTVPAAAVLRPDAGRHRGRHPATGGQRHGRTVMTLSTLPSDAGARAAVRHLSATLAYRAAKVLRDPPSGFATTAFGTATRRPVQIVAHMADLMTWAVTLARGEYTWKAEGSDDWDVEVRRFFTSLETLDREVDNSAFSGSLEKLIQGPLADALTHVGQLAMLRGMAGDPIRPESYARAEIVAGRVGMAQAPARAEFDGDASLRR